jgi:peptidoglycan/LPS O-acetylase OafA/YrhL
MKVGPSDSQWWQWSANVLHFGFCGVDLFFVLSGFLITRLLLRDRTEPHHFRNFYARRTLRIFPLYFGVLTGCVALGLLLPSFRHGVFGNLDSFWWLGFYATNIFQSLSPQCVVGWGFGHLDHFWSLAVEEHFYLVWPLLISLFAQRDLRRICVGIVVVSALTRLCVATIAHNLIAANVLTVCRMEGLAIGALVALNSPMLAYHARLARWIVLFGLALMPIYFSVSLNSSEIQAIGGPTLFGTIFGAVLIICLRGGSVARAVKNAALIVIGKYSYGLYVFHYIIIGLLLSLWHHGANKVLDFLGFCTVAAALSMFSAVASYHCYEVHFLKLKRFFRTNQKLDGDNTLLESATVNTYTTDLQRV